MGLGGLAREGPDDSCEDAARRPAMLSGRHSAHYGFGGLPCHGVIALGFLRLSVVVRRRPLRDYVWPLARPRCCRRPAHHHLRFCQCRRCRRTAHPLPCDHVCDPTSWMVRRKIDPRLRLRH